MAAAAPGHMPGLFTPGAALLKLAVTALDVASPPGPGPLEYEEPRERYLPEVTSVVASSTATASTPCTPPPAWRPAARSAKRRRLVADPAVAVRRLRRCHLQPGRSRAPRGPGGGIARRSAARQG